MKIFVGIPSGRSYKPFWDSMDSFIPLISKVHEVEVYTLRNKTIAEARNLIVDRFLKSDKDYLLFLDDDHSGHSIEMLNALINAKHDVVAVKCYTKEFPYNSNLMEYSGVDHRALGLEEGQGNYRPIDNRFGYGYCDLVGFGMTLVSRETFSKIEEPYFSSKNNQKEDNYFCDKLVKKGIKPVGYFEDVLEHQGIGKYNAINLRNQGIEKIRAEVLKHNPEMTQMVLVT